MSFVAYVEVLTEHASQVAHGEEDRPATSPSSQAILLAHVGEVAAHDRMSTGLAGAGLVFQAVGSAVARAGSTFSQTLNCLSSATLELSGSMQLQVGGAESYFGDREAIQGRIFGHDVIHGVCKRTSFPRGSMPRDDRTGRRAPQVSLYHTLG